MHFLPQLLLLSKLPVVLLKNIKLNEKVNRNTQKY